MSRAPGVAETKLTTMRSMLGASRKLHKGAYLRGCRAAASGRGSSPFDMVNEALGAGLEVTRMGMNEVLRSTVGLEVKHSGASYTPDVAQRRAPQEKPGSTAGPGAPSFFWNPYAEGSPFRDRAQYLAQFQRLKGSDSLHSRHNALQVMSEEDIESYVEALATDGSVQRIQFVTAFMPSKTLYSNVVKIVLHVIQVAFGGMDGSVILGREVYLLRGRSARIGLQVAEQYPVDEEIVKKLVNRILSDHEMPDMMSAEVQRQMYHNIVTLVFRLWFDLTASFQVRILGHTLTIKIEADEGLAKAPGWEVDLDSGIFGRFEDGEKREFVEKFVDDLLEDDAINMAAMPDVLEKQLYMRIVWLLFDLLETACNHTDVHIAGLSYRAALTHCDRRGE